MATDPNQNDSYGADSIKVLKGLDAVRKRPGMYIGDTDDGSGLHHMVFEVSDNAIDEALAGHCDRILIQLNPDGSVTVEDNGRGIPTGIHAEEGVSAAEVIMTQLHAGGKFENTSRRQCLQGFRRSPRRRRVASSTRCRNGSSSPSGVTAKNISCASATAMPKRRSRSSAPRPRARRARASPSCPAPTTFKITEFDFEQLEHRYRELAFLNSGVRMVLADARHEERVEHELYYEGGIAAFVNYLDRAKTPLFPEPIAISAVRDGIGIDVALEWNDSYYENVLPFTNNIPQRDGGTHMAAFRAALTRTINGYAEKSGLLKKEKVTLTGDDMREGLTAIVSVKLPDPKFSSQTKDKLVSSEVRQPLESLMSDKMSEWLEENPAQRALDHPEDHRRRGCPRSRPQSARGEPQVGDGHRLAAGQARRLPGARSRTQRTVPGRGRQRRRLGQAGPQPPEPGHPSAQGQDPQCRARAVRSHARLEGNRHADPGARHVHRRARSSTSKSCAITRSSS